MQKVYGVHYVQTYFVACWKQFIDNGTLDKISINVGFFTLQETEKRQEEERIRMENILSGNPLLNYASQVQKGDLKVSG